MTKLYTRTAFFIHKPTQKLIYRLDMKTGFKYLWEKEKVLTLERLAKEKFINKHEIEIRDHGTNNPN
jgi:hypothetical protein